MFGKLIVFCTLFVFARDVECRRVVDLSYDLYTGTINYPIYPRFNFTMTHEGPIGQAPWVAYGFVDFAEHTGTHVDTPNHFYQAGLMAHQVSLDQLMGPGVVIDVKEKVKADNDYRITDQDLMDWESEYGRIPSEAIVLMDSGWGVRYHDWNRVFNTDDLYNFSSFHFPSFGVSAAQYLVDKRDVHAIGVDVPSTDYGLSSEFPVHQLLSKEGILMIENVANMNKLPPSGAYIYVPMIKFRGGTGGPARMFATLEDEDDKTNAGAATTGSVAVASALAMFAFYLA